MMSCKQIVRILSADEELSLMKRAELKMHLMMCKHCSRYSRHLKMMAESFRILFRKKMEVDDQRVVELKREVVDRLKKLRPK